MTTQTQTKKTKCTLVKQAMKELLAYRQSPTSNNTGLIHRMKHLEKLCVIHGLTQKEVQTMTDAIFGQNLV